MFEQHPIIPIIFCAILIIIIIKQSFVQHRFLKIKALFAAILAFISVMILIFYNDFGVDGSWLSNYNRDMVYLILLVVDILIGILFFSTINSSYGNERLQQQLTKTLDETKYYVVLDNKDRVKTISSLLLKDLNITLEQAYKKNFFDVLEYRYRIIAFNQQECDKNDIKKFYYDYFKNKNFTTNKIELNLQNDDSSEFALYFFENPIIVSNKYKGRILMGEKKSEENLIGMEKDLAETSLELDLIKNRFVTILEKTSEGIFFNNLSQGYIWCNDILVKKLSLSGNSLKQDEFYKLIHPDDLALFKDKMNSLPSDYSLSYRFNTGSSYTYVKEEGHKIVCGKTIELCGIMTVIDNYRFAKTDTILDTILGEPEMLARIQSLENTDKIFEVVYFKVASIPQINEQCGRAIGNTILAQYVSFIKQNFVNDNQIYRLTGLDFVAIVTDYRKMDVLKNNLINGEKILHAQAEYANEKVITDVYMGISRSDDHPSHKDTLKHAKEALRFCSNPQFNSNFAYYKDIR